MHQGNPTFKISNKLTVNNGSKMLYVMLYIKVTFNTLETRKVW